MVGLASKPFMKTNCLPAEETIVRNFKRLVIVAAIAATAVVAWQAGAWAATAIEYGLIAAL